VSGWVLAGFLRIGEEVAFSTPRGFGVRRLLDIFAAVQITSFIGVQGSVLDLLSLFPCVFRIEGGLTMKLFVLVPLSGHKFCSQNPELHYGLR